MKNTLLTFGLALTCGVAAFAQGGRYLEPQFNPMVDATLRPYGANVTVLPIILGQSQTPQVDTLMFRLYTPAGDDATRRPVVIIHHTGSYMPIALNGGLTGSIEDAAVRELAARFAAFGYVAVTPEYRQGWNTIAPDVDEQTETLLIASLRGAQDLHMMCRYLRKTVAEDGNPFGIDGDRILAVGLGTGGYNVNNANFLDRVSEVNTLDKFIDSRDNTPYYDSSLYGNPYGTDQATLNVPNWASYENGFQMGVNLGGAMGDLSWIEGRDSEAPIAAMHSIRDQNAPFGIGDILVPTTGNTVLQDSPGSRIIVGASNDNGNNAVLLAAHANLLAAGDGLTQKIESLKDVDFTTRSGTETTLATESMYPWIYGAGEVYANEYNYTDTAVLGPIVRPIIAAAQLPFTFEALVQGELRSNRNFLSPAGARLYLDTIMQFILPRAYAALDLQTLVDVEEVESSAIGLTVAPNPARESAFVRVSDGVRLDAITVVDALGREVRTLRANSSTYELDLAGYASGVHYLLIRTDQGVATERLLVE